MDLYTILQTRQSIRKYQATPVEQEKLERILQAANAAPSAGNRQAYEIYVARSPELRGKLAKAALDQTFIEQAPLALVFCTNPERNADRYGERGEKLYSVQDATIACSFAILAAAAEGLGCVWVGAFREAEVAQALDLPFGRRPVIILPLGYPDEAPVRRTRRRLDDLAHEL